MRSRNGDAYILNDEKSYLVLSGGLGSSPYVRQRLVETYNDSSSHDHPNADGMQILVADEPYCLLLK